MGKLNVAVIFGGKSGEHEVSINSAESVIHALDKDKYNIIPIGIRKNGEWIGGASPLEELKQKTPMKGNFPVTILPDPSRKGLWRLDVMEKIAHIDVIFPVLHGPYGEDGTLQGLFELSGLPYVGSGVLGSSLAMDKAMMKQVLRSHGLRVADHLLVLRSEWRQNRAQILNKVEQSLAYPMFVKPVNLGSSVGISKVKSRIELEEGLDLANCYDMKCLVEEYIPGKEIEVSIMGNDRPYASICGEVIPANEFYDYDAKYLNDQTKLVIPASLEDSLAEKIQNLGKKAYQALGTRGLCRVDFLVREDIGEVVINELNTMPGFTSTSMYPKLWESSGTKYTQLLSELIGYALKYQAEKDKNLIEPPVENKSK